jgi:hypothetical protein
MLSGQTSVTDRNVLPELPRSVDVEQHLLGAMILFGDARIAAEEILT